MFRRSKFTPPRAVRIYLDDDPYDVGIADYSAGYPDNWSYPGNSAEVDLGDYTLRIHPNVGNDTVMEKLETDAFIMRYAKVKGMSSEAADKEICNEVICQLQELESEYYSGD